MFHFYNLWKRQKKTDIFRGYRNLKVDFKIIFQIVLYLLYELHPMKSKVYTIYSNLPEWGIVTSFALSNGGAHRLHMAYIAGYMQP